MDYTELRIPCPSGDLRDLLMSDLAEQGFDAFQDDNDHLLAYIPTENYHSSTIGTLLQGEGLKDFKVSSIPHQNWNAVWESNYEPVVIPGKLFIGATFHTPPENAGRIIKLDPNMSFGTGHHPTTFMILEWMIDQDFSGQQVYDFGAGSGVLSILASQLGGHGEGIEIDAHAADAAMKNLKLNEVDNFTIRASDLEEVKQQAFEFILANINRNVILERLSVLISMLKTGGRMACSGFLVEDGPAMKSTFEASGLTTLSSTEKEGWLMMIVQKTH